MWEVGITKQAPLKIAMCACLILGIGGCMVDMTLPESANFPSKSEWLVALVGGSTNPFELVSVGGWIVFLLGVLATSFRIK